MLEFSLNYNQKEHYRELVLPLVQSHLTTTQASLAIQLAQLVKTAKRSAVLEERRRLAGEIHDSLGQSFSGIHMHLAVAAEAALENGKEVLSHIKHAMDLAKFGLSEAPVQHWACDRILSRSQDLSGL